MRAPDFWRHKASLRADLLTPFGDAYGAITASRAVRTPRWKAPIPVLCVGNVTVGGSGKTPVCLDLAARLAAMGEVPHLLTRGYGGRLSGPVRVDPENHTSEEVGDEALLLANAAPTWVGSDRVRTAKMAVEAEATVLLMDDGFQNPGLAKSASILVFDGGFGVGNGKSFPAGPLREPLEGALLRAQAAIVIGDGDVEGLNHFQGPVFRASVEPDPIRAAALKGRRVIAFAGIGRPEKFFQTLRDVGAEILRAIPFADHHAFRRDEVSGLISAAEASAASLVTTVKDRVRLPPDLASFVETLPISLTWTDEDDLQTWLQNAMAE